MNPTQATAPATGQITYTYRGGVERGTGAPGYRWHDGYSATSADGCALYPWLTKRECQADARAQGARAIFVVPVGRCVKAPGPTHATIHECE